MYEVTTDNLLVAEKEIVIPAGINPNYLNYCIIDLQPNTIYQLKVKAVNKAGESSLSEHSAILEIGIYFNFMVRCTGSSHRSI
jgi:hypothetical protein